MVVFRLILGFSRRKCHSASLNGSQPSIFEAIEHGLWKFDGAPKELAELGFIEHAYNILFIGPAGIGKSHLSIALGLKACAQRKRVLFTSAMNLLDQMVAAVVSHTLGKTLEALGRLDLLMVDELCYMPVDIQRGNLFFQLISRRYEKGSIILSTNKPFDRWGEIFEDDVIASAILDRLLHNCHIIPTSGPSYQIKDKLEKLKSKELNKMAKVW